MAKISVLDSKIDAMRVDQQTIDAIRVDLQAIKAQHGDVIRMVVDLTKLVTTLRHSQVEYAK